ncbi:MAG: TetR/AcrR family transcriptional regulator, partial [Deltaproteobacteria bacterium]|nr:TetR/AcrR family transcriptional regulator [Deltaproteobacteria bacterium]
YGSYIYKLFDIYTQILNDILEEGKEEGSIRANVNILVFKNMFLGTFSHMALRWVILEKEADIDKMREIDDIVLLLSQAVTSDPGDQK